MTTLLLALAPAAPIADHEHVITVYGGTAQWKQRLACNNAKSACLVLLDPQGNVRWVKESLYDGAVWTNLQSQAAALLDTHPQTPPIR